MVQVNIIRQHGYYGQVSVKWLASGDQNGLNDITPLSGVVRVIYLVRFFPIDQGPYAFVKTEKNAYKIGNNIQGWVLVEES